MLTGLVGPLRFFVNSIFDEQDAFSVILCTLMTLLTLYVFQKLLGNLLKHGLTGTVQLLFVSTIKRLPGGQGLIDAEMEKSKQDLARELKPPLSKHKEYRDLPEEPVDRRVIREELLFQLAQEKSVRNKRGHGGIYVKVNHKYDRYLPAQGSNEDEYEQPEIVNFIDKFLNMKV